MRHRRVQQRVALPERDTAGGHVKAAAAPTHPLAPIWRAANYWNLPRGGRARWLHFAGPRLKRARARVFIGPRGKRTGPKKIKHCRSGGGARLGSVQAAIHHAPLQQLPALTHFSYIRICSMWWIVNVPLTKTLLLESSPTKKMQIAYSLAI